jgi:quercetin dioxygenase-like cupin family protein
MVARISHRPAMPSDPTTILQRRFITAAEKSDVYSAWSYEEWLCRPDIVANKELLLVRATIEAGRSHPFHTHPTREELIYVLSGQAEQWVGKEYRILNPGEVAFIPAGEVHGLYNVFETPVTFLAILGPAIADEPGVVDVSDEEPWKSIRAGMKQCIGALPPAEPPSNAKNVD